MLLLRRKTIIFKTEIQAMLQDNFNINSDKPFNPQGFAFINIFGLSVGLTCFGMLLLRGGNALGHCADRKLVRLGIGWDDRNASLQNLSVDFSPVSVSVQLLEGANPTLLFVAMLGFLVVMLGLKLVFGSPDNSVRQK